jgi:hypothetical protein
MTLSDGAVAALAAEVADHLAPGTVARVRPPANDDPYRWGGHGWLVHIDPDVEVWIAADSSPQEARAKLLDAVRHLRVDGGP